jgi:hypothetical protein
MNITPKTESGRILRRIERAKPGWVFTRADFLDLSSTDNIGLVLARLENRGLIRRIARGIYDAPRRDPLLGELWPSVDSVVKAVTSKGKLRVQPTGVYAANLLGLSEQVPARVVLLTDGPSRSLRAGPMRIELKHTTPRNMAGAGRLIGLVIEAFRSFRRPADVTPAMIARLRDRLPAAERKKLLADLDLAPGWMLPALRALAEGGSAKKPSRKKAS